MLDALLIHHPNCFKRQVAGAGAGALSSQRKNILWMVACSIVYWGTGLVNVHWGWQSVNILLCFGVMGLADPRKKNKRDRKENRIAD